MDNRGWIKAEEQLPDDGDCVSLYDQGTADRLFYVWFWDPFRKAASSV